MKKLLFLLLIALSTSLPVQAAEQITIKSTPKDLVYKYTEGYNKINGLVLHKASKDRLEFKFGTKSSLITDLWGNDAYTLLVFDISQIGKDVLIKHEVCVIQGNQTTPFTKETIQYLPFKKKNIAKYGLAITIDNLCEIKSAFNGRYSYGYLCNGNKIVKVLPNFPAMKLGLKVGDRIIKINNCTVNASSRAEILTLVRTASMNRQPLELQIQRGKEILDFKIPPTYITTKEYINNIKNYRKEVTQ